MHYILEVSRCTNIVYIEVYLVLIYIEILFSTVCYFLRCFCWSANCMSWISKSHNIFLKYSESEASFLFESYIFEYYNLKKVQFQLSCTFLAFSIWSINCSSHFFSRFAWVNNLYELSLWFLRCPQA